MLCKAVANKLTSGKSEFRFRGLEVRRVEAYSYAVFAFAFSDHW